jgi:voltage-gated potassium channel
VATDKPLDQRDTRPAFARWITAFVARHEVAWELAFAALAAVFVSLAFIPVELGSSGEATIVLVEWSITGVFVAEFGTRLWATADRRGYLRGHWIDLVSLVPPARWFRPFRLLRLLRLLRAFAGVGRALTSFKQLAAHRGLVWLLLAWVAVMLFSSVGLYVAENGANDVVQSPLDAIWWGIVTMTTVGYGDIVPKTPEGKLAATVLMVLGIGLFSGVTATVTSFLLEGRAATTTDPIEEIRRLGELRDAGLIDEATFAAKRDEILRRV